MRTLTLHRRAQDATATLGEIEDEEHFVWARTVEPPWKNNEHGVSCIPAGTYACGYAMHHGKYKCPEVLNVPDRSAIHMHVGNAPSETQGCVLLGTEYGPDHSVTESQKAFDRVMSRLRGEPFTLNIVEDWCNV